LKVMRDGRRFTVEVLADGDDQTVSHVGRRSAGRDPAEPAGHDPGRSVTGLSGPAEPAWRPRSRAAFMRDLAMVLADGRPTAWPICAAVRDQAALFGPVAS